MSWLTDLSSGALCCAGSMCAINPQQKIAYKQFYASTFCLTL